METILAPGSLESQKQHALRAHPDWRSGTKHSHTCTHIRGPGWGRGRRHQVTEAMRILRGEMSASQS